MENENVSIPKNDDENILKVKSMYDLPLELYELFNALNITEQTKTTYYNDYMRLKMMLKTKGHIGNLPQKKVLEVIQSTDKSKLPLLNIAIMLYKNKNNSNNRLVTYREKLYDEKNNNQADKNKMILENSNATYDDLIRALNEAKNTDYVLFYLLQNYNLRNLDLILKLITDKKELNKTDNFLLLTQHQAIIYINNYKTKDYYGEKIFKITDEKFRNIIKLLIEMGNDYVLETRGGNPYNQNTMGKYIKARYKVYIDNSNLSQSVIYKIIQNKAEQDGNIKEIFKMSKNRGHLPQTALTSYSSINKE